MCDQNPDPTANPIYFIRATDEQQAHCKMCDGSELPQTVGITAGALVALAVAFGLLRFAQRKPIYHQFVAAFSPVSKGKILIGFYVITTRIDTIYDVALPADVRNLINSLFGFLPGLPGVATTPLACAGFSGYIPKLVRCSEPNQGLCYFHSLWLHRARLDLTCGADVLADRSRCGLWRACHRHHFVGQDQ